MLNEKEKFCESIREAEQSLYTLAYGIVRNEHDAADVLQDAALKAYCSLEQLKDWKKFKSWMLSIVHNTAIEYLRRQKKLVGLEEQETLAAPAPALDTAARISIWEAVQALPLSNRSAIILYYYEGYSVQQIAAVTDTTVAAVKQQLFRGRKQLAQLLHKEDFFQ